MLLRLQVEPSERNSLKNASQLMIDKISTVPRAQLGRPLGKLDDADVARMNRALTVFLGIAG